MSVSIQEFDQSTPQVRIGVARIPKSNGKIGWMDYTLKVSGVVEVEGHNINDDDRAEIMEALEKKYFPKD